MSGRTDLPLTPLSLLVWRGALADRTMDFAGSGWTMTRNATLDLEGFDPDVLEAARDVARRAGIPVETWIASIVDPRALADKAEPESRSAQPQPAPVAPAEPTPVAAAPAPVEVRSSSAAPTGPTGKNAALTEMKATCKECHSKFK